MNPSLDSCRGGVLADRADFLANTGQLYVQDDLCGPLSGK